MRCPALPTRRTTSNSDRARLRDVADPRTAYRPHLSTPKHDRIGPRYTLPDAKLHPSELGYQEEGEDLPEMELNDGMPSSVAVILRLSVASSCASLSLTPL
jgi:hypothetical protein